MFPPKPHIHRCSGLSSSPGLKKCIELRPLSLQRPTSRVLPYGKMVFFGPMQAVFHSSGLQRRLPLASQAVLA